MTGTRSGRWANHAGGYWRCSHTGCSKKADEAIPDHDCCGRCSSGRACRQEAVKSYAGPGTFSHRFADTMLNPGICQVCGEARRTHPRQ